MANLVYWYQTQMPEELVDIVCRDLEQSESFESAKTLNGGLNLPVRDSKTQWIPESHWVTGLCWHYVMLANQRNFMYDIDAGFENAGHLQYTSYEPGEYYHWHVDGDLANCLDPTRSNPVDLISEKSRKLSFVLQLSSPEDYTGGEMQLQYSGGQTGFMPKTRGTIIVFDSRCLHRVKKIITGRRKSLVGWVAGPRWK